LVTVRQPLLPGVGDLGGQVQAGDAGMVALKVGPKQLAKKGGQRHQGGVVQRGLAFPQVVHQQIADGLAGQPVAVDQLLAGSLAAAAQFPQRRRGAGAEDPQLVQRPVEQVRATDRGAADGRLDGQQLQDVADGDLAQSAALGGKDLGSAVERPVHRRWRHAGVGGAQRPQPSEALGVPQGEVTHQRASAERGGDQPTQRGPDHVGADRHQHRPGHGVEAMLGGVAVLAQPGGQHLPPGAAGGVGTAGQPAVLPGWARLVFQPVQQHPKPEPAPALAGPVGQHERRPRQACPGLLSALPGRRPRHPLGPRRPHGPRRRWRPRPALDGVWALNGQGGGHEPTAPNSTASVSGR
jgi:hypothetical protein